MKQYKLNPKEVWLVGDTLHDFDVAEKLGCQCILVSQGHQSRERLRQSKAIVVENLENVISIIE
jgi:phosphoglycolate phosphatase